MTTQTSIQALTGITIRRLNDEDTEAVARLVELDSAEAPRGELLGAEIEGRLVAVTPVAGGRTIADPFSRTTELRDLLELRAGQIRGRTRRTRGFGARRSRASLPSSPPGAGGRLLTLFARIS